MSNKILDDNFHSHEKITTKEALKARLTSAGLSSFYDHQKGFIRVEEGDAVQVDVHFINGEAVVKPRFPQIGNSAQIIASALILAIFLFVVPLVFPIPWIVAIAGGQLISYLYFMPKTKQLKDRIEQFV